MLFELDPIQQQLFNQQDDGIKIRSVQSIFQSSFNSHYSYNSNQFRNSYHNINANVNGLSIKFKGVILSALAEKYQPNSIKIALFKWFSKIDKISQNRPKQILNRFLTGKYRKITKQNFLYRLKEYIRITEQSKHNQQLDKCSSKKSSEEGEPLSQISNKLINQVNKNNNGIKKQNRDSISIMLSNEKQMEQTKPSIFKKGHTKAISGLSNNQPKNQTPTVQFISQHKVSLQDNNGISRSQKRSNTIASLKSIIDQKVFKKKSQNRIQLKKSNIGKDASSSQFKLTHSINLQEHMNKHSTNNEIQSDCNQDFEQIFGFPQNQLQIHKQIQKNFKILKNKKSLKIIHTLKIVKQVSTVLIQSSILNIAQKRKGLFFQKLKQINNEQKSLLYKDYEIVERELQMANQNIQKQEQLQQLAQQLQQKVNQIDQLQQQIQQMNLKMKGAFLQIFIKRISKIINKRLHFRFIQLSSLSLSQMNILPQQSLHGQSQQKQQSSDFLEQHSGIYGQRQIRGTIISDTCQGLNSVKMIIQENDQYIYEGQQNNQNTYREGTGNLENHSFCDFD